MAHDRMSSWTPDGWHSRCSQVLVALASELTGYGLNGMLAGLPGIERVDTCADADAAMHLLATGGYDVLMVALESAFESVVRCVTVARQHEVRSVLLLSGEPDDDLLARIARLPVDGFLAERGLTRKALHRTLTRMAAGEIPMPESVKRGLLAGFGRNGDPNRHDFLLTAREQEALVLLAEGLSNKQIAGRMNISLHGAKRHVANVLAKLNRPNRTLAVTFAIQRGLVPGTPELAADAVVGSYQVRAAVRSDDMP